MRFLTSIPRILICSLLLVAGGLGASQASAATAAVTVTDLNMRAGPSTSYPVVVTLPTRASLRVYGCTAQTTWCDVSWGASRGWVSANYIQVTYNGSVTVITPTIAPAIGLTVVAFNQAYWNTYYVGKPWYNQYNVYVHRAPPPPAPYVRARGGCVDGNCGGAVATPHGRAIGGCNDVKCGGAYVRRGPNGQIYYGHGSFER